MNHRQSEVLKAAYAEYDRFEGIPRREAKVAIWDHLANRRRVARCIIIDLGKRPPVPPADFDREDLELIALRGSVRARRPNGYERVNSAKFKARSETLCQRLHAWLKSTGAATHHDAAKALEISESQAKHLLTSNAHMFKCWKKIAGQSYFIAV